MQQDEGWIPHPEEEGAWVKTVVGIWHSILPGVPVKVVAVWRKGGLPADKRSGKRAGSLFLYGYLLNRSPGPAALFAALGGGNRYPRRLCLLYWARINAATWTVFMA